LVAACFGKRIFGKTHTKKQLLIWQKKTYIYDSFFVFFEKVFAKNDVSRKVKKIVY